MEELRGLVLMRGGPRFAALTMSEFLDVLWAHICTPPSMADPYEWTETMFCWFYLGREPIRINEYDATTKRKKSRIAPREQQLAAKATAMTAENVARSADDHMARLRERRAANAELRESRRKLVAAERLQRLEEADGG